jgi:alkanesulfonate monooxygenase SsuD/methylene tetrahydromethanopterin reductase-like flavin-dependent oxidoreductase (luciferase family)
VTDCGPKSLDSKKVIGPHPQPGNGAGAAAATSTIKRPSGRLLNAGRNRLVEDVVGDGGVDRTRNGDRERLGVITRHSKIRGFAVPTKESFMFEVGPRGALFVGSPETVAQKIVANLAALGANRFDLKYGMPGISHDALMKNVELYGTQVIPRVRALVA